MATTVSQNAAPGHESRLSGAKQALLEKWLRRESAQAANLSATSIPRRATPGSVPLSFEQQRLWFFYQLEPQSPLYHMPIAARLRGRLRPEALQRALDGIVARHETLRTRFTGEAPLLVTDPPRPVQMKVFDLREFPSAMREAEARRLLETEAKRPFDLSRDLMLRAALVRMDDQEWIFLALMHHIASDDWSWRVLCNELALLYDSEPGRSKPKLPELPIQYGDFVSWQQQRLRDELLNDQLAYWRQQLAGAPQVLELPIAGPRPARQTFRGSCAWLSLPLRLSQRIDALSQQVGATPFTFLLAAFQTLLHRYTGQSDLLIGSPVAGRNQASVEGLIGVFINTLILRMDLSGNPPFSALLRGVQGKVLEALAYQELPFERLVAELQPQRSPSYSPLIQMMFALQTELSENLCLPGLAVSPYQVDTDTAKFDLTFTIVKSSAGLNCCAEYNSDLFERPTIERMLDQYQTLLEGIASNPDQRLSDLPLLTSEAREQLLVQWNRTEADYPRDRCIHDLVASQAAQTPEAIALVFEGQQLSYRELNRRANQLGHYLARLGVAPEKLVALGLDRSLDLVIALLAILKAGGAYMPLDASYPAARLKFMLKDSGAPFLVTRSSERDRWTAMDLQGVRIICLDEEWPQVAKEPDEELRVSTTPGTTAYVIYTSGSTGQPKGVQVPHRAVVNCLQSMRLEPGLGKADTLLSVTSISFDVAALEIFLPLMVGARLVLAGADTVFDGARLAALIDDCGATVMQATPTLWRFLIASGWTGNQRLKILCGGESLSRDLADQLLERAGEVWNLYGPTETTIWSTRFKVEGGGKPILIGRPIANTQVFLLDAHLQPVPIGLPGELHIGGDGLAKGYLDRPQLTADKFIPNPFGKEIPSPRLYKTGDVARYQPDGNIEFLGRADDQVKLRGRRIDLGEIEFALQQHPKVRQALVLMHEDEVGEKQLVAYVIPAATPAPNAANLQQFLKAKLPDYMIPAAFITLEHFPTTPNGKVDRRALSASTPNGASPAHNATAPRTALEEKLAKIWREVMELQQVGVEDNFFEMGGHSVLAMMLMSRVRQEFQVGLTIRDLFERPTIAAMAKILEQRPEQTANDPAAQTGSIPRRSSGPANELLGRLVQLSNSEVEALLEQTQEPGTRA